MDFKSLHHQPLPLLMANVWDAASAHAASEVGYQAIGTSSAAIANLLGYADGEDLPLSSLKSHLVRIAAATSLPLSIDMENGYGREASQVVSNLVSIAELGADPSPENEAS